MLRTTALERERASFADLRRRVAGRYRPCGRYTRGYVDGKLRLDSVHRAVLGLAAREPFGRVVDLGCGRGQLGVALLESGLADSYTGLDWDERLLAEARVAAGPDAAVLRADLRTAPVPEGDSVLLIDVLYQMPAEAQLDLLRRAATAACRRVIVRAFDPERGWRSGVGWLAEGGIWLAGLYRRARVRPLPPRALAATLDAMGFACTIEPCWGVTPLPNVLLVARRTTAGPQP